MRYIIKRIPVLESWVFMDYEYKTVSSNELSNFLKEDWEIHRKEYFIVSYLLNFWNSYDRDKKTDIVLIFVSSLLGYVLGKI